MARAQARDPPGSAREAVKEALGVDDDPRHLGRADDPAGVRLTGDHAEAVEPAVTEDRRRGDLDAYADPDAAGVLELDPRADRGLALAELGLDRRARRRLAPREQPRRTEDREAPGAQRRSGVVVRDGEPERGHR